MFKKIMDFLRKGAIKIGLIKSIGKLSEHKDISMNEEMYTLIETYKNLYKGYHEPFHKIKYKTIAGEKERKMDTMNMAKASAAEMASLVFNEKCEISIGDGENETSNFIDDVFKKNKFYKKFQDYLEYSFAMGGMVIKPYVDDDKIKLSFVTADCFIPLMWSNESIYEGVFINEFQRNDKKYTHLEWHVWESGVYTVKNEVYESTHGDDLGVPMPLEQFFPGLEPVLGMPKIKKPLFVYFKPNTANNIDIQSPLGIPLYANALSTMKAIDTAFDSFHREFRLGKKRIIVPEAMIKTVYDQDGIPHRYFDSSDETYESFNTGNMDDANIVDVKVELRVEEHTSAINALLNLYAMQTGFSAGTFTFDGMSMKTATEVVSEQSKTFKSKQSHEVIIEAGLQELIESILAIADTYSLFTSRDELEISITFDDSIAEDKKAEIDKQIKMVVGGLQSRKRAIMKIHGVTEEEALEILNEANSESLAVDPVEINDRNNREIFGDEE